MKFIVVGYYSKDELYTNYAQRFIDSMEKFNILHYLEAIDSLGNWHKNTGYKPTFIKRMMKKFPNFNIVYNDVDAEFEAYPELFNELDCGIAVYNFDRRHHRNIKQESYEILSGTIFLKNVSSVFELVEKWEEECKKRPMVWDQKSLEKILQGNFYNLPPQYCTIFDVMKKVKNRVVVHYQASREMRKRKNLRVVSGALSKEVS